MTRITKKRDVRRNELIDTARHLFIEKGYDNTSVNDIVSGIGVAQGTFYYHFRSKSDILYAIGQKMMDDLVGGFKDLISCPGISAAEKLNKVVNSIFDIRKSRKELGEVLHDESNILLHDRLMRASYRVLVPLIAKVISEGMETGQFEVAYPVETAEFLVIALAELEHKPSLGNDAKSRERMKTTVEEILGRVLQVEEYRFSLDISE